jgi:hypothetical protein
LAKSIMFSIAPITDRSKSAGAEDQASQLWTSISHLRGSGLGVAIMMIMMTVCTLPTQRIGGLSDRGGDGSSASGEWIREQRPAIKGSAIRRVGTMTGMTE